MTKPILRNTSLCAIVRDEMMNPAGGIIDFVESTVPYVEEAVMVDAGSVDGTKDVLVELAKKYSNLRVFSHAWQGYADARNNSLSLATKDYILVLDADERLTRNDFTVLKSVLMNDSTIDAFDLDFLAITPDEGESETYGHNPRLFKRGIGLQYFDVGGIYELIDLKALSSFNCAKIPVAIKHFLPDEKAHSKKIRNWYMRVLSKKFSGPPTKAAGFSEWKAYNPMREHYK